MVELDAGDSLTKSKEARVNDDEYSLTANASGFTDEVFGGKLPLLGTAGSLLGEGCPAVAGGSTSGGAYPPFGAGTFEGFLSEGAGTFEGFLSDGAGAGGAC